MKAIHIRAHKDTDKVKRPVIAFPSLVSSAVGNAVGAPPVGVGSSSVGMAVSTITVGMVVSIITVGMEESAGIRVGAGETVGAATPLHEVIPHVTPSSSGVQEARSAVISEPQAPQQSTQSLHTS
jgi:hypothetical protein